MADYVDRIWEKDVVFLPKENPQVAAQAPRVPKPPCPEAQGFREWCRALCADLTEQPTYALIRKKKDMLQDEFWNQYFMLDHEHKEHIDNYSSCLFHVYRDYYKRLRLAQIAVEPADEYFLEPDQRLLLAKARALEHSPPPYTLPIGEDAEE
jgi:hypothetical protein